MSLYGLFQRKGANGYGYNSTAEEVTKGLELQGKNILITGCNSGLGKETARVLSLRGAYIMGTARTLKKALLACDQISVNANGAMGIECELSDPLSVKKAVNDIKKLLKKKGKKLDAIICNAGIMALPELKKEHKYELQFFTNHVGHFILVTGLLDLLANDGRVVMLSSTAHTGAPAEGIEFNNLSGDIAYKPWKAYGQSKFANLLFSKELASRFKGTKKIAIAVHPGVIRTNLTRHMNPIVRFTLSLVNPLVLKSVPQGAATQCYAAVHPDAANHSGEYFADCNPTGPRTDAENPDLAEKLWKKTEEIIASLKYT